jgi:hypothetical protein
MPVLPGTPIPANGSIIIMQQSGVGATITLIDPNGMTIEGTIRMVGLFSVWTPSRALSPGAMYTLSIMTPGSSPATSMYPVSVIQAWTPARVPISNAMQLSRYETPVTTRCCTNVPGVSKGITGCFDAETRSYPRVQLGLTSTASPAELGQFLFKLTQADVTPALVASYSTFTSLATTQLSWNTSATQYCVDLEAIEITSGRSYQYADLMARCIQHGALGEIGVKPAVVDEAKVLGHDMCPIPPPNYEMRWCELNKAACGADRSLIGCENYGHLCLGEAAPRPPTAGSGAMLKAGSGGSGGTGPAGKPAVSQAGGGGTVATLGPAAGSGTVATLGPAAGSSGALAQVADQGNEHVSSRGCAVRAARGGRASAADTCLWFGLTIGLIWRRRRR